MHQQLSFSKICNATLHEFDDARAEVKLKLRELGVADTSPWRVVVKGGTAFYRRDGTLKRRQTAFCALNAYLK